MTPIFPNLPQSLGTYTLTHLLGQREHSEIYSAQQEHMDRQVLIEVLHPDAEQSIVHQFLKNARARVNVKLPAVAQVFESMVSDDIWYITQEKPNGSNLETFYRQGAQLTPLQVCAIMESVSQLYIACEKANLKAAPLSRADIFLIQGKNTSVRFLSPIYDSSAPPTTRAELMQGLASSLEPLLPQQVAGQTRIATLLQWIRDGYEGEHMEWPVVNATAMMIEEQLSPILTTTSIKSKETQGHILRTKLKKRKAKKKQLKILLNAVTFIGLCCMVGAILSPSEPEYLSPVLEKHVICTPSDENTQLWVTKHPVSILQYQRFLAHCAAASKAELARINRGLPDGMTEHTPTQWQEQLNAAANKSIWQGRQINEDAPVRGVSYWSAKAYANYCHGLLPSLGTICTVRDKIGQPKIQEWTSDTQAANVVLPYCHLVLSADSKKIIREQNPARKDTERGFRIALPTPPKP